MSPKIPFYPWCANIPLNGCQMRSRCQGVCIDRHIRLFTYNIIALLLMENESLQHPIFNKGVSRMTNQIMP